MQLFGFRAELRTCTKLSKAFLFRDNKYKALNLLSLLLIMESVKFEPNEGELPSAYAERLGIYYSQTNELIRKKQMGQFFTPISVAEFMASFCSVDEKKVRILDPGTGIGILSCTLIEYIIKNHPEVTDIELTAFEIDENIISYTDLALNYLNKWVSSKNISIVHLLCKNDFILHNSRILNKNSNDELYDIIISNPPYFKIPSWDSRAQAAKNIICGQSNVYSIFMIVAAKLLTQNGRLIFITPRSFTSGRYFKEFREIIFSILDIKCIHLFAARNKVFERDGVLQENIIISARRKQINNLLQLPLFPVENTINISYSLGIQDLKKNEIGKYQFDELVEIKSEQKVLHIPSSNIENSIIRIFKKWTGSFEDYGISISTGPVVDFRNMKFIISSNKNGYVPLIYLHNIDKMSFKWPLKKLNKNHEKGQYIEDSNYSKRLVPNNDYILIRRFSSKDDHSKLVASPYLSSWLSSYDKIGIENHLNYFYRKNGKLSIIEIYGISGLLNSKLFDVYFRTFNGNINVSATELRQIPLPPMEQINAIGNELIVMDKFNQERIDTVVKKYLIY